LGQADTALGSDVVNAFGIAGDTADAEALIIDLVPVALSTDSVDGVVASNAATLTVGKNFIDSAANDTETALIAVSGRASTGSRLGIKSGISRALGAGAVDDEVGGSTGTCVVDLVVDLVGEAGDSADLESDIKVCSTGAGLADATDEVEPLGADALLVDEDHVGTALTGGDGEGLDGSGGVSSNNAVSTVESVSLDAVASLGLGVVDGVGRASSALAVDVVEARLADAGEGVNVKDLVEPAGGPADGELGIVVVGGSAVSAGALDHVVPVVADADVVDQVLVESAGGRSGDGGGGGRHVGQGAVAVDELVAWNAQAGEGGQVVGRVGGADITGRSDKIETLGACTSTVLVDLVLSADCGRGSVGDAGTALEVVADEADALAENVVVYLIIGAGDLHGGRTSGRGDVRAGLRASSDGGGRPVAKGVAALAAAAVDVLVGLVLLGVVGAAGDRRALGADRSDQQGY
jgi:hypothetical protein